MPPLLKRAAFPKVLRRLQPLVSVQKSQLSQNRRKVIFINWRRLYWGSLEELLYGIFEDGSPRDELAIMPDTHETRRILEELHRELQAFARHYNLKIVWRQTVRTVSQGIPDVTNAFLEYWSQGLSKDKKAASQLDLATLCKLAIQNSDQSSVLKTEDKP